MSKRGIAVLAAVSLLVTPSVFAADANALQVTAINCLTTSQTPRVTATVPASAKSARVYFKAQGQIDEYYVDMRKAANGSWFAFLPMPDPKTTAVVYRVVSSDDKGLQTSSAVLTTTVAGTCPPQNLTADDQRIAENLVVGLTVPTQSAVPQGFQCKYDVSFVTAAGELKPNEECRKVLAAAAAAGTTTAPAGGTTATGTGAGAARAGAAAGTIAGMSAATFGALAAVGLGAVGYAVYDNNKSNNQASPSRP